MLWPRLPRWGRAVQFTAVCDGAGLRSWKPGSRGCGPTTGTRSLGSTLGRGPSRAASPAQVRPLAKIRSCDPSVSRLRLATGWCPPAAFLNLGLLVLNKHLSSVPAR